MIKSFECYTRGESVTIGAGYLPATKWKKAYDDGQWASLYVADSGVTRAKVREAFEEQESGAPVIRPREDSIMAEAQSFRPLLGIGCTILKGKEGSFAKAGKKERDG